MVVFIDESMAAPLPAHSDGNTRWRFAIPYEVDLRETVMLSEIEAPAEL
ncbi:MAG: hypothetical protein AB2672_06110 [Candidatus Thiodiazotropha endolucinida]